METRYFDFAVGIETSAQPDPGTPVDPFDFITLSYLQAYAAKNKRVTGTFVSPYVPATAGTAIAHGMVSDEFEGFMAIEGPSVGTLDLSNANQIAAGTRVGARLITIFTSDSKRIKFENGSGLEMLQGDALVTKNGTGIEWHWDGSKWKLTEWNNVGDLG